VVDFALSNLVNGGPPTGLGADLGTREAGGGSYGAGGAGRADGRFRGNVGVLVAGHQGRHHGSFGKKDSGSWCVR